MSFLLMFYIMCFVFYLVGALYYFFDIYSYGYEDEEEKFAARMVLLSPVWPIPVAYLIYKFFIVSAFRKTK